MTTLRILLVAMFLLLSACRTDGVIHPSKSTEQPILWQQHHAKIANISAWRLKGKIAVKSGRKGGSATLHWAYQPDHQAIELYGPFGSGRVQITVLPTHALLKDAQGNAVRGDNAAQALYKRLGWQVPFEELHYWVRGIPAESKPYKPSPVFTVDATGRLRTLQQNNWVVEYQEYQTVGQFDLPHRLSLTAAPGTLEFYTASGEYIGDYLSVQIILKYWRNIQTTD